MPAQLDEALRLELAADLKLAPEQLQPDASLLQLGLDSLRLMAWLNRLRSRGHRLTLRELFETPTVAGWSELMRRPAAGSSAAPAGARTWPTMRDGESFALTPVQHAYFVGRSRQQVLGGVGCHLYQEFDGAGLTAEALEAAVEALIARHPMLNVAFRADGQQHWREQPFWRGATVHDLREMNEPARAARLRELREKLGHRVLNVEQGETFDFQLSLLPGGRSRLHVNIDLLVLDAASFTLVFEELAALLAGRPLPPSSSDYDFRSYLAQSEAETRVGREQAIEYWRTRLADLPPAPALPLAQEPESIPIVRNTRRRKALDAAEWRRFTEHAGACGVTPTMALATCFGAVLARWSGQSRLLLNLTLFDRQPLHPAVERMIADFTNITLLDLVAEGAPFCDLARANQGTFADAYEHRSWSGVEVLRELRKAQRHPHGAPIVFTSNLGRPLYGDDTVSTLGEPGWGISQTPQVWIDHLAFEHASSVCLQWDSNDALFPEGLVDTLFEAYVSAVRRLAGDSEAWLRPLPDLMPTGQREVRARVNDTAAPLPAGMLHEGFLQAAERTPEATAVIHRDRELSYGELAGMARRCAGALVAGGVRPGDRVAISMSKGIGQVAAALGVLTAGAVYVPVPLDQPEERRRKIYEDAGVGVVLLCEDDGAQAPTGDAAVRCLTWQEATAAAPIARPVTVGPGQPAYVIYTSGSTGMPKGVVISHRGALNTCVDLNRRYNVGPSDRVLAISALHFDLSVYDIFGLLSAGGALVLLDEAQRRDPAAWCDLIARRRVTIWNSVPALFDMLLTYAEGFELQAPAALRAAMLSGDWIGLDLPARYRAFRPDGQFIAMGGATEASIWSNVHDVVDVAAHWRSIPYGRPLANQRYRVVDEQGRDCPDWSPGELWIGGAGVALGYFNDAERTARQFVEAADGRWYRTGDVGCYWPDGTLEFLGRRDKQVKIGGYRIELGEIEAALNRLDGVRQGVAVALGERDRTLAAFVVPSGRALCAERHADPALPADYQSLFTPIAEPSATHDAAPLVAAFLDEHLQQQGLRFDEPVGLDEAFSRYGAQARWRPLLARWFALLVAQGRLTESEAGYRRASGREPAPAAEGPLAQAADALPSLHATLPAILRGQRPAEVLLDHPFWAPEQLLLETADAGPAIDALAEAVSALARRAGRPLQVVQIGARSGFGARRLLQQLDAAAITFTALDASQDMVLRAQARLERHPSARVRRWTPLVLQEMRGQADVVLADNALHRLGGEGLDALVELAAPGALVHVLELRRASALSLVSADLLSDGEAVEDRLRDAEAWTVEFAARGLLSDHADIHGAQQRFVLRAPPTLWRPDPKVLAAALADRLPGYMLPQRIHFLDVLPLTANGKVDQKALAALGAPSAAPDLLQEAPASEAEQAVAASWRRLLQVDVVHRHSHFFELGGDSLLATRLIGELGKAGYAAQLGDLFDYPALCAFAATLAPAVRPSSERIALNPADRHLPFALTDVQQAYLVGRQPGFDLSGVGSQFFVEFEVEDLDVPRFEAAWNHLIQRHDMLRAVVRDGHQQVLPETPPFALPRRRFASLDSPQVETFRDSLSRQVLDPARWPVFDVQAAEDGGARTRLFVCLDNLMLDGLSMQVLLAELEDLYLDPGRELPALEATFRDYLAHMAERRPSQASLDYWRSRLESLPAAPQLPLRLSPAEVGAPRFVRLSALLAADPWRALKARAADANLTPSALLLAAYGAVLSAWSAQQALTLNLTLFDRQPVHPQIEQVLGDFTSLLPLAWEPTDDWIGSAQRLQRRLWRDLAHRDVSGLWVMRQLAQSRGRPAAEMPVVFTSALGFDNDRFLAHSSVLKPRWGVSQTPQVWLDHQVFESEGELRFNWDAVEALFEPAQLRQMFGQYVALLDRLARDPAAWRLGLEELVPRARRSSEPPIARPVAAAPATGRSRDESADPALVERLREHFRQLVGSPIAARQNFFDAGASSLKLVQLHVRLQQCGYTSLAVTDLFAHPSPQALAGHLGGAPAPVSPLGDRRLALLEHRKAQTLRRRGEDA